MSDTKWLIERIISYKTKDAFIYRNNHYSYNDLFDIYTKWSEKLKIDKVCKGEVIAVLGDYSPETSGLILALIENKNIILPLTSADFKKNKIYFDIAQIDRVYDLFNNKEFSYNSNKNKNLLFKKLNDLNNPGLILFSSGSTGKPKAVVHNFKKIADKYLLKGKSFRALTFFLMNHIGGINTLFYTLSNGGTVVIADNRRAEEICKIIEKHKVELLPASPTFLNLLFLSGYYKDYDLSSLKIISYGTETMPENLLKKLNEELPFVSFKQTYGLSELGILQSKSRSSDSLWVKVGGEGYETKIVNGKLFIKTNTAMLGYLNAPDPFDEEGWFNTEDRVEIDGEYIKILGRDSDIINVGGQKVYPSEVENILCQISGIKNAVVYGEANAVLGNIVTAKVNLTDDFLNIKAYELKQKIKEFCNNKIELFKIPVKIVISDEDLYNERFKKIRNQ